MSVEPVSGLSVSPAESPRSETAWRQALRLLNRPLPITTFSLSVGWAAILLSYQGHWLGVALAALTSAGGILAIRRGRILARERRTTLEAAIRDSAARNRELELLRRLGSTLLSVRSSGELLEEAANIAEDLLRADGSAIMLVVEEGRFLKVSAGTGVLRPATGNLLPVGGSLAGWSITHDQSIISKDMEHDPRNFPVDTLPPNLRGAVCVPLRTSSVVIGTACAYSVAGGREFDERDVQLLTALGEQVAVGIDRAFMLEESRRGERELAEKNRELVRATKLKDEFLANMSHELRTPLNAIIGFSDLLLMPGLGPKLEEQQRDFLESIARNGRHLLGLINSVLDLSKIEAGRMTVNLARVDVRDAIDGAVTDTASLRSAKGQQCLVDEGDSKLELMADHLRLRQVLFNLLSNASKFTPEDGTISLSAVRTLVPLPMPGDRAGERPRLISRDAVWITVRDTGIGIAPNDIPKLFQAFTQVDSSASRQAQGTGLGLALCKQFVELHGGTIGAESVPGEGSAFWFIMPVDGPIRHPV
jgi:signal transduction histidine kinase